MAKSKKIGIELEDAQYIEALDRIKIVMDSIDRHLIQHPVLKAETNVKDAVDEAATKLWEAYQLITSIYE
tara:strand:- start:435 stop:644 length:210 start_codon:yes stop_codon:yes gene_type:complete